MRTWVSVFLTERFLFYLLAIHKYPSTRYKYFFRGFGFSVGWDLGLVEQNKKNWCFTNRLFMDRWVAPLPSVVIGGRIFADGFIEDFHHWK